MAVQIDRFDSEVEILPPDGAARSGGAAEIYQPPTEAPPAQGTAQLKEALRPVVMELIEEEIEHYLRMRG